jgi:flagellar FliL protein
MANGEDKAMAGKPLRRRLTWLVIGIACLVLAAGGGALAYVGGLLPGGGGPAAAGSGAHGEEPRGNDAHVDGHDGDSPEDAGPPRVVFVDVPDLVVNLRSDAQRMRFLKLRMSLEFGGEAAADAVRGLMPRVMDSFQLYLRALTVDELNGPSGMQRLKEELTARVNLAIEPIRVDDVLMKEMLVQ